MRSAAIRSRFFALGNSLMTPKEQTASAQGDLHLGRIGLPPAPLVGKGRIELS
jgi:hypothetical protein